MSVYKLHDATCYNYRDQLYRTTQNNVLIYKLLKTENYTPTE